MSGYRRRTDPRGTTSRRIDLGGPLLPHEVVHHVNEDKGDSHRLNLAVLPSRRAHMLLHWYQRREVRRVQRLFDLEMWLELKGVQGVSFMSLTRYTVPSWWCGRDQNHV